MSFIRNLRNAIDAMQRGLQTDDLDDPFGIFEILEAAPGIRYGVPKRPSVSDLVAQSRAAWVPPGQTVTVAGKKISIGMLYTGSKLDPVAGWETVDPALIDPALPIEGQKDPYGLYGFGTSYTKYDAKTRASYLQWLARGARTDAFPGFVSLRMYGLERRILFDARHDTDAREELPVLIEEVRRLAHVFDQDPWFLDQVTNLLVASYLIHDEPGLDIIPPTALADDWQPSFAIQVALGVFATERTPLPSNWALSWICSDRDTNLRTPALRCPDEFVTLFHRRYQQLFGMGIVLKPPKPQFTPYYYPMSSTFGSSVHLGTPDLPDLSRVRKPQKQLRQIVEQVTAELDEYSRHIGRHGDPFAALALAVRPAELGDISEFPSIVPLAEVLRDAMGENAIGLVDTAALLASVSGLSQPPTQKQASLVAALVRQLGYGIEPDPETDRRNFLASKHVALYRGDPWDSAPGSCAMQRVALAFGAVLIRVDGSLDARTQAELINIVATAWPISIDDTLRLGAYVAWLADHPITLADAKRLWNQLDATDPDRLATVLVRIASSDGQVSVAEMQLLTRIYPILGRSEQDLHTDLHQRIATRGEHAPATSGRPRRTARGNSAAQADVELDAHLLRQVQTETSDIQRLLGTVFTGDDEPARSAPAPDQPTANQAPAPDPYLALIAALAGRKECSMDELGALARAFGLMPAGAIEAINDRALALGLGLALDCDDAWCEVDPAAIEGLLVQTD